MFKKSCFGRLRKLKDHFYTNNDFYKDGLFQPEVAKEAVKQFILDSGMEYTERIDKDGYLDQRFWIG